MNPPAGVRLVRGIARATALAYPRSFRLAHARAFTDVAQHLWERESAASTPARATLVTARILIADTLTGCGLAWMAAVRDDGSPASWPRQALARLGRFIGGGWHDLGLAARSAARRPGFALLVILTLGVGIGTSAAAFDALDRAVLRPLPFHDSDRLVMLAMRDPQRGWWTSPSLDLLNTWRERAARLEGIEIYSEASLVWHADEGAERLSGLSVSGGLPGLLGVTPIAGRLLQPADAADGAPAAVMLTEPFWRSRFGADPGVVGRTLSIGATPAPVTVVGIWPAGARLHMRDTFDLVRVLPAGREYREGSFVHLIARKAPNVSNADVERELASLVPPTSGSSGNDRVPDATSPADLNLGAPYIQGLWLVFAGGVALLIVSIVNAGHLLLGRAAARTHELGVRLALGGSPLRLLRLFVAESAVYVTGAVAAGIGVMIAIERAITYNEPRLFMAVDGAGLEGRAIWFIAAASGAATLACASAPLLRARSRDLRGVIDASAVTRATSRRSRATSALVVAQASLAVLLVCGAFVMIRSFTQLMAVDPGMALDRLAAISVAPPAARYATAEARAAYLSRVREALETIPSVTGVTTSGMPLLNTSMQVGQPYLDGEEKPEPGAAMTALNSVPPDYFGVTGMRVLAGRGFREDDDTTVAVVNESFAQSRGGHDAVIGRQIYSPMGRTPFRIVGVVADVKLFGLSDQERKHAIYFREKPGGSDTFARFFVRTTGDPAAVVGEARRRIVGIDRAVPMFAPETGPEVVARQTSTERLVAVLLVGMAAMGFVLALAGIYGSVALDVSLRTREIGVRMALGATRQRVMGAIVGAGVRPVVAGGIAGVALAWVALPYVEALLYRVDPRDPASTGAAFAFVALAAVVAAWLPARHASRIDPAITLRQ
jgi:predicted permease